MPKLKGEYESVKLKTEIHLDEDKKESFDINSIEPMIYENVILNDESDQASIWMKIFIISLFILFTLSIVFFGIFIVKKIHNPIMSSEMPISSINVVA